MPSHFRLRVARVEDVLARQPAAERSFPHAAHALGRDHELLARRVAQRDGEHALGLALRVHVRGVEQVDARVERVAHDAWSR